MNETDEASICFEVCVEALIYVWLRCPNAEILKRKQKIKLPLLECGKELMLLVKVPSCTLPSE